MPVDSFAWAPDGNAEHIVLDGLFPTVSNSHVVTKPWQTAVQEPSAAGVVAAVEQISLPLRNRRPGAGRCLQSCLPHHTSNSRSTSHNHWSGGGGRGWRRANERGSRGECSDELLGRVRSCLQPFGNLLSACGKLPVRTQVLEAADLLALRPILVSGINIAAGYDEALVSSNCIRDALVNYMACLLAGFLIR